MINIVLCSLKIKSILPRKPEVSCATSDRWRVAAMTAARENITMKKTNGIEVIEIWIGNTRNETIYT